MLYMKQEKQGAPSVYILLDDIQDTSSLPDCVALKWNCNEYMFWIFVMKPP